MSRRKKGPKKQGGYPKKTKKKLTKMERTSRFIGLVMVLIMVGSILFTAFQALYQSGALDSLIKAIQNFSL